MQQQHCHCQPTPETHIARHFFQLLLTFILALFLSVRCQPVIITAEAAAVAAAAAQRSSQAAAAADGTLLNRQGQFSAILASPSVCVKLLLQVVVVVVVVSLVVLVVQCNIVHFGWCVCHFTSPLTCASFLLSLSLFPCSQSPKSSYSATYGDASIPASVDFSPPPSFF